MTREEARCIDRWIIGDKEAEAWSVKGKLQIRHRGVIHNVNLSDFFLEIPPKPKIGHWIVYMDAEGKMRLCVCDQCGYKTGPYTWKNPNYCPNCGVKMIEPPESEEV